jgi:hypothetical protein
VESKLDPLGTSAIYWPTVPAPGDCEDGEIGGMNGRGNRSTRRKPAPAPLCPPQIPLDQTRDWTRAAAVGIQRLTASAMARPMFLCNFKGHHMLQRIPKLDSILSHFIAWSLDEPFSEFETGMTHLRMRGSACNSLRKWEIHAGRRQVLEYWCIWKNRPGIKRGCFLD